MTERSGDDSTDHEEGGTQEASADSEAETDEWQFDPDLRWGGEDGDQVRDDDWAATRRDRLPGLSVFNGVFSGFRGIEPTTNLSSVLKGAVRFLWVLAVGLIIIAGTDQVDPRRQVEYSRLVTEIPLITAIGVGVLGVVFRTVSRGGLGWPSAGVAVRTTVLLALLVALFAVLGPAGVI